MMQADAGGGCGGPVGPAVRRRSGSSRRTDLDNAKLPAAADPESQLDVLLRPGLAGRCRDHRREDSERDQHSESGRVREGRQADRLRPQGQGLGRARDQAVEAQRIGDGDRRRREAGRSHRHERSVRQAR